jgi:hypothetical protein
MHSHLSENGSFQVALDQEVEVLNFIGDIFQQCHKVCHPLIYQQIEIISLEVYTSASVSPFCVGFLREVFCFLWPVKW